MTPAPSDTRAGLVAGRWSLIAGAWAVVIIAAGVLPMQGAVHAVSGGMDGLVASVGHFGAYALLGWLLLAASAHRRPQGSALVLAFAGATGLGIAIELAQAPLPYRDCQVADAVIDAAGAALGLVAFSVAGRRRSGRRSRCG